MRPYELLPIKSPHEEDPCPEYFYNNVAKPITNDLIRIMNNGITMDQEAVDNLKTTVTKVLDTVEKTLVNNSIIKDFQKKQYPIKFAEYEKEIMSSCRDVDFYIKPYKPENIVHRTYVVNEILKSNGVKNLIKDKWSIADIKKLYTYIELDLLAHVISKSLSNKHPIVIKAMKNLAINKMKIWNKVRIDKVASIDKDTILPPFSPASSKQKQELFSYLGFESPNKSKTTGNDSWDRAAIEELYHTTDDETLKELLQAFIDHSFSAIIRNNFLESFDKFTIGGKLHGNIKNFGAKSYRLTSNSPNLLNMPSTASIYAKPLKKCFIAPEGWLVWAIDYSALEERVLASLSKDTNKCNIFLKGLDSHCFNALGYFKEEISKHIKLTGDLTIDAKTFKNAIDAGNKELKAIRQKSKPINFKLNYQGMTDSTKGGQITPEIYDAYHNKLYKQVGEFRDDMITTCKKQGYIHLGLGCRLYSDDVDRDYRTLFNAYGGQFWSILTLIAINELHYQMGNRDDILINATIYDSIYGIVKADAKSVKWLNDTLVPIMETDFIQDQIVKNEADLCIGTNWANVEDTELKHNESIETIQKIINKLTLKEQTDV